MPQLFIDTAMILAAISGLPGLALPRNSRIAQWIAFFGMNISALLGLFGVGLTFFFSGDAVALPLLRQWYSVANVDALSAFFLVPVFLMGGLGSLYGLGYWPQHRHPSNGCKLQLFWGFLVAGMILLIVSKHGILFLFGWETMALSSFFLITTEDNHEENQRAGWIYFIATHISTLTLFTLFALWRWETGFYFLHPLTSGALNVPSMMSVFFLLILVGFGLKAGIMPFHFWLPAAHATAPSHVSAILSGVVLKMGIYGIVRWMSFFPHPPYAWGTIFLVLGFISGLFGVVFAIAQHDLKRLLAYHSVENIGIIMMGLGVAMIGKSSQQPVLVVLGMAGCLLHVWNHSFFKSLLFLCAGSVIHHTHTRHLDRMGGLAKIMPWTAAMFLIGAVAICGLPPLNGFVSELFVYLGLFNLVTNDASSLSAAFGVAVLAMIGALAGACFVKVYGIVFLGSSRFTELPKHHAFSLKMHLPLFILGGTCVLIGVAPMLFTAILTKVIAVWYSSASDSAVSLGTIAPLTAISTLAIALILGSVVTTVIMIVHKKNSATVGTWDCGYAKPASSMQYTASSFARSIVSLFDWVLRSRKHSVLPTGTFPAPSRSSSHVNELVLDRVLIPVSDVFKRCSLWFHRFQHGFVQQYILYIVVILLLMLCFQFPIKEYIWQWFGH